MIEALVSPQGRILAILAMTVALFLWGRFRHDVVALTALLAAVGARLVPPGRAFEGFGHPAVITVASVLILSQGLQSTGAVDRLTALVLPRKAGPAFTLFVLCALAAFLSAFMNNVGALALLMPVAMQIAPRLGLAPGRILMPLAFSTLLGGMTTLIGTPPNLIVSGFRAELVGAPFTMFDFSPTGVAIALGGIAFIVLGGWRLVPDRRAAALDQFQTGAYLTEALIPAGARAVGLPLRAIEAELAESSAVVVGLVRGDQTIAAPSPYREVHAGDILLIEADPSALSQALAGLGLTLEGDVRPAARREGEAPAALTAGDVELIEMTVRPASGLLGRSIADIRLRERYGLNLLALSREGRQQLVRLQALPIRAGDVLLLQGSPAEAADFASRFGLVPLARRSITLPSPAKALGISLIMALAVAAGAFGLVPTAVGFSAGVVAAVVFNIVPARRMYEAVDWPVIILLGALMPVAGAMSSTGAADWLAQGLVERLAGGNALLALVLVLVVTMSLSDFMNNAATAAVMCPIAVGIAARVGASPDPYLMAVAIAGSCAFLTPIGHQNNTLILGPGGFRFGDYWRLGLPLELLVIVVAVPLLVLVWPL